MTKSRHNTFGFWMLTLVCLFPTVLFLLGFSKYFFGVGMLLRKGENVQELRSDLILFAGLSAFFWIGWCSLVKNITVNATAKSISFQNILTRKQRKYLFSDFDGFIDTAIPHDNTGYTYQTIGLVKNKRIVRIIDSFYHSNVAELRSGLSSMPNMGQVNFGFFRRIKMLLKYPVLD